MDSVNWLRSLIKLEKYRRFGMSKEANLSLSAPELVHCASNAENAALLQETFKETLEQ